MKKKLKIILSLSSLYLLFSPVKRTYKFYQENTDIKNVAGRKLNDFLPTSLNYDCSEIFVQKNINNKSIRFVTAINMNNVYSIKYIRTNLNDNSTNEISVTKVYKAIKGFNDNLYYYNNKSLTNEINLNNYYFACLNIEFDNDINLNDEFYIGIKINDELINTHTIASYNNMNSDYKVIKFLDFEDNVIEKHLYKINDKINFLSSNPSNDNYIFDTWDKELGYASEDVTFYPLFKYDVNFYQNNQVLSNGEVFNIKSLPTFRVELPSNLDYRIYYTKDDGATDLGEVAPQKEGTYAINVFVNKGKNNLEKHYFRWYIIENENLLNENNFESINKKWGNDGNNGVISSNVKIVNNEYIITSTGANRTGGAICSKNYFDEGSYTFEAKCDLKSGTTMAFWLFYYQDNGNINHEIDIEAIYDNTFLFSSYTSESDVTTIRKVVENKLNDNNYHKYRFDFYNGEKVEYYIDGIKICTIDSNVPTLKMKLWMGLWCPSWSGDIVDENSTLYIKSFNYEAF